MGTGGREEGVLEKQQQDRLTSPPLFKVMLLNDDFTPMEFVVTVLESLFLMDRGQATRVMLQVHMEGTGVCGVYPKDMAATKVDQVVTFARKHEHPLQCVMEET